MVSTFHPINTSSHDYDYFNRARYRLVAKDLIVNSWLINLCKWIPTIKESQLIKLMSKLIF